MRDLVTAVADGDSEWISISERDVVAVTCPNWSGAQAVLQLSWDASEARMIVLDTCTANKYVPMTCSGYVRLVVSSYGGSPIEAKCILRRCM